MGSCEVGGSIEKEEDGGERVKAQRRSRKDGESGKEEKRRNGEKVKVQEWRENVSYKTQKVLH